MNIYEFKLIFKLPPGKEDAASHIDALGEAGCDDALIGIGRKGRIALDFAREASQLQDVALPKDLATLIK